MSRKVHNIMVLLPLAAVICFLGIVNPMTAHGSSIDGSEGTKIEEAKIEDTKLGNKQGEVESISLDKTTLTLQPNSGEVLIPTVVGGADTDKTVSWSSDMESVASVDMDGKVTAHNRGEATITAVTNGTPQKSATCKVTVVDTIVKSVTLDKSQITLKVGESDRLTATVSAGQDVDKTVTWNIKEPSIATIDKDGNVTGLSRGITVATATVGEVTSPECKIIVNNVTNNNLSMDAAVEIQTIESKGTAAITIPTITDDIVASSKLVNISVTLPTSELINLINKTTSNSVTINMVISRQIVDTANLSVSNIKLEKSVFDQIKAKNKTLTVNVLEETSTNELYTWIFETPNITRTMDVDLNVKVVDTVEVPAIRSLLTRTTGTAVVQFTHSGNLPGKTQIRVGIKDKGFITGNSLYLYFYNSSKNRLENGLSGYRVDSNGYVLLSINHCSQYLLTKTRVTSGSSSGSSSGGSSGGSSSGSSSSSTGAGQSKNGSWILNSVGWWYRNSNGSYTTNGWQYINNYWYLFDANGYMLTGWQLVNGQWFYLQSGGNMISNDWFYYNNNWYYFRMNGSMNMGWVIWKDRWYYNNGPSGGMATNLVTPDGYMVGADGVWKQP